MPHILSQWDSRVSWLPDDASPQGGDEYLFQCYACDRLLKFAWNAAEQTGRCLSASCGVRLGGAWRLRRAYSSGREVANRVDPLQVSYSRETSNGWEAAYDSPECAAYLAGRGVSLEMAEACGAIYSEQRVGFPLVNVAIPGRVTLLMSRSILPGMKGWRSARGPRSQHVFGALPKSDTVIIVEGVFDVLTPGLWGRAVASCGTVLSPQLRYWLLTTYKHIVLWWDPDARDKQDAACDQLLADAKLFPGGEVIYFTSITNEDEPGSLSPEQATAMLKERRLA